MKICATCKACKDLSCFYDRRRSGKIYKNSSCIECVKARARKDGKEYYIKNRKECLQYAKEYRTRNSPTLRAASREYYSKNKYRIIAKSKTWATKNHEKILEYHRKWNSENRDKLARNKGKYDKKISENLTDVYVAAVLRIPRRYAPKALLEMKKEQLQTYRLIRRLFEQIDNQLEK